MLARGEGGRQNADMGATREVWNVLCSARRCASRLCFGPGSLLHARSQFHCLIRGGLVMLIPGGSVRSPISRRTLLIAVAAIGLALAATAGAARPGGLTLQGSVRSG